MKRAHVRTIVRIALSDVAAEVAQLHGIGLRLASAKIDGDILILEFGDVGRPELSAVALTGKSEGLAELSGSAAIESRSQEKSTHPPPLPTRRKRRSSRRNRMKTRGWNVVTKATNSHGQTVTIYEPFVKALRGMAGSKRAKEKVVSEILRANGNKPGPDSVRYYLENTLQYLTSEGNQ